MSEQMKTAASMEELFAASIDDLADLPAFEVPPPGSYVLMVTCEPKEVNNKPVVEAAYEIVEVVELADPENTVAPAVGTKFNTIFMIDNEYAIGNLKKFLSPFQERFQAPNLGALVTEIKQVQIAAFIKNRKDKNDADKKYAQVENIEVA